MEREKVKTHCIRCHRKAIVECPGCSQHLCFDHLQNHRQELYQQLEDIEKKLKLIAQKIDENISNSQYHEIYKTIDHWETVAKRLVEETAKKCKHMASQYLTEYADGIKRDLSKLNDQTKKIHEEDDLNDIMLDELRQKLEELSKIVNKPPNIAIQQDSTSFINKITVVRSTEALVSSSINSNTKSKENTNEKRKEFNQFSNIQGIYVDHDNQCIYIADYTYNRIVKWKYGAEIGEVVIGGNQLNRPTDVVYDKKTDSLIICDSGNRRVVQCSLGKTLNQQTLISDIDCFGLAMDKNDDLYISDSVKNEVIRCNRKGDVKKTVVAGGHGKGNNHNQLNSPTYIYVDDQLSVYVLDSMNWRVIQWNKDATKGVVVASERVGGKNLAQLFYPKGVTVDPEGYIYVTDCDNQRTMRWTSVSKEGNMISVGNGRSEELH